MGIDFELNLQKNQPLRGQEVIPYYLTA